MLLFFIFRLKKIELRLHSEVCQKNKNFWMSTFKSSFKYMKLFFNRFYSYKLFIKKNSLAFKNASLNKYRWINEQYSFLM